MTISEIILTFSSIIILLAISGFLSGTETAMTAISRPRLVQWKKNGNDKAGIVLKLLENTERLIGTLLIGNNFVNILSSALATSLFINLLGEAGIVFATIIMTVLVVIFSEVLPKVYALSHADSVAVKVSLIIRALVWILTPFNVAVGYIVEKILKALNIKLRNKADDNEEELRGAIELHTGDDPDFKHEREMLRSVMDLDDTHIAEAFTHRKNVITLDINEPIEELIDTILSSHFTYFPVIDGGENIIGIIHSKELLRMYHKISHLNNTLTTLETLQILKTLHNPRFVPESTSMLDQLQAFRDQGEKFALVVDEYGTYMGCITMTDILEHIVGDVSTENSPSIRLLANGSFLIDGDELIRNVNRELDWALDDEYASTVAGYILHESQTLPSEGQTFIFNSYRFVIVKRNRQQITKVRIEPLKRTKVI